MDSSISIPIGDGQQPESIMIHGKHNNIDNNNSKIRYHHYQQQQQQQHNSYRQKTRSRYYHGSGITRYFKNWTRINALTIFHRVQLQCLKHFKTRSRKHVSFSNILLVVSALICVTTLSFFSGSSFSSSKLHQRQQQYMQQAAIIEKLQRAPKKIIPLYSFPKRTKSVERLLYSTTDPPIFISLFGGGSGSVGRVINHDKQKEMDLFHPMPQALISSSQPDYGELKINFLENGQGRIIHFDPNDLSGHVWTEDEYEDEGWDEYYSFDDDFNRNIPFEPTKKTCRRVSFHRNYFPNCNLFHEIEIMKGTNRYLGSGAYREAYLQHETYDPDLVVKVQRFRKNPFTYDRYEFIRMDALVMERLTASPRIADIYGHCATSVYSEFLPDEAEERIIPGDGDGSDLNDKDDVDPKNNFTISEKLDLALQMAESIADLHGYKYGVIVHDDIQLAQFLFAPDGRLKLNDFNRAEAMLFDEKDGSYCRYQNGKGAGDYRSPEEYKDGWLNEKIDIWSFGNNIYGLITGLWVFYIEEKTKVKQKKLMDGEIAYLDPRYKGRNYIQDRLIELMYRCWVYEPDDRIDIFQSVSFLRETLKEAKRQNIYDGRF